MIRCLPGATVMLALCACGDVDDAAAAVRLSTPQALIDCAQPPTETLQARLWISGSSAPCALDVDGATTSGTCDVVPGIERVFTIDWFQDVGGQEVLLAQAQTSLDLTGVTEDQTLRFTDDDISAEDCRDMRADQVEGSATVRFQGQDRPVCDLDGDGDANLTEVCRGDDPTGRL